MLAGCSKNSLFSISTSLTASQGSFSISGVGVNSNHQDPVLEDIQSINAYQPSSIQKFLSIELQLRNDYKKWKDIMATRLNKEFNGLKKTICCAIDTMEQSYSAKLNEEYQIVLNIVAQVKNAAKDLGEDVIQRRQETQLLRSLEKHKGDLLNRSRSMESLGLNRAIKSVAEIQRVLKQTNQYYGIREQKIEAIQTKAKELLNYKKLLQNNTKQILEEFCIYKKLLLKPLVQKQKIIGNA